MQTLDITTIPLEGTRLIEASAGTGKTWTIAGLYLRQLLEAGRDLREILVVTFTEAATAELRERVRATVRDALAALDGDGAGDASLRKLLAAVADPAPARRRLRAALAGMDEAAVFTIHGFCQRVLAEHAFESGALFEQDFATDEYALRLGIVEDFWRREFYAAPESQVRWARGRWGDPRKLHQVLTALDGGAVKLLPELDGARVEEAEQGARRVLAELRRSWNDSGPDVIHLLETDPGLSRAKDAYRPDNLAAAVAGLQDYLEDAAHFYTPPAGVALFSAAKIAGSLKRNRAAPAHPFFDTCQEFLHIHGELLRRKEVLFLREAVGHVRAELAIRKAKLRVQSFDDLLTGVACALAGEGGEALAGGIRERYPVALIDEFQDTDPVQYDIFHRIYQRCPGHGLYMIGDPKQAIYGFRGADVFTYIEARHDTDPVSEHFTMDTNWRSCAGLVDAINALFARRDAPFVFADDIAYHRLSAAGAADRQPLALAGEIPVPLQAWFVPATADNSTKGVIPKTRIQPRLAAACAGEVVRLLALGRHGQATLEGRSLAGGDLALLVRDRNEAKLLRDALTRAGVSSVYVGRESVFETEEARELALVLRAVAQPANEGWVRAALSTALLGFDASSLEGLGIDDRAWEVQLQAFENYHRLWLERGFMVMFQRLLHGQGVPQRLLAGPAGERRMTDLAQLGELLQAACASQGGIEGLLRWYAGQRSDPDGESEEQQQRLESDENLVRIVTIHKSKGMEYPVVFLPFAWANRSVNMNGFLRFHDPTTGRPCIDIGSESRDAHWHLAERERLAEDMRLLYVALTRAKYLCYFAWGQFRGAADSAMAYLLHGRDGDGWDDLSGGISRMGGLDDAQIQLDLQALNDDPESTRKRLEVMPLPELRDTGARRPETDGARAGLSPRVFRGRIERDWRIASYSSLVAGPPGRAEQPDHDAVENGPHDAFSTTAPGAPGIFGFPRGARAGTFIHSLFENLDFPHASGPVLSAAVSGQLERHGYEPGWRPVLETLVENVLDTVLDGSTDLRLRSVGNRQKQVELEFHFPLAGLGAAALDDLTPGILGSVSSTPALDFSRFRGVMKGFIDLVFEHEGRFYLLDYKSNHLGDTLGDYVPERLRAAMAAHRYDVQLLIYTVAVHRYLGRRLAGYDYERHFGGAWYLFLRGMDRAAGARSGVFFGRPSLTLVESLDRQLAGAAEKGA